MLFRLHAAMLLGVVLNVVLIAGCGNAPEQGDDCANGRDDDDDGLIDCDDPHCTLLPGCHAEVTASGLCGNGTLDPFEGCEDANQLSGDGCSPSCAPEPSITCGNGIFDFDPQTGAQLEECEDGNRVSGDRCSASCRNEYCGDGIVQPGLEEQCDDGPFGSWIQCTGSCQPQ